MTCHKEGCDCEEVVCEVSSFHLPILSNGVNHDACPPSPEDTLDEVEAESRESISVRNCNHADLALDDCLQKGTQPWADTRRDVFDDFETRVGGLEVEDLAVEVSALLRRTDAGVNDLAPGCSGLVVVADAKARANVVGVVEAFSSITESQRFDVSISVPFAERAQRHPVAPREL